MKNWYIYNVVEKTFFAGFRNNLIIEVPQYNKIRPMSEWECRMCIKIIRQMYGKMLANDRKEVYRKRYVVLKTNHNLNVFDSNNRPYRRG